MLAGAGEAGAALAGDGLLALPLAAELALPALADAAAGEGALELGVVAPLSAGPTSSPMLTVTLAALEVAVSDTALPALCCTLAEPPSERRLLPLLPWEWPDWVGPPADAGAAPLLLARL
jgi:hypothetical protein